MYSYIYILSYTYSSPLLLHLHLFIIPYFILHQKYYLQLQILFYILRMTEEIQLSPPVVPHVHVG